MSAWQVFEPGAPEAVLATVSFGVEGEAGPVVIETAIDNVRELLAYYLDDPLDQNPVYIHGLGFRHGPHWQDREQFEIAMSVLQHHCPTLASRLLG